MRTLRPALDLAFQMGVLALFNCPLVFLTDCIFIDEAVAAERVFKEILAYRTDILLIHLGYVGKLRILAGEGCDLLVGQHGHLVYDVLMRIMYDSYAQSQSAKHLFV